MKKAILLVFLAALFSVALSAGRGSNDREAQADARAVTNSSQWSHAFAQLSQKQNLDPDLADLVDRAMKLGTVDQFDMKDGEEAWLETKGEQLKEIMAEARSLLSGNAYIDLLLSMEHTQIMLHALAVIPVSACNCNGLCDCNDVAPMYSRCQNAPCLRPFPTPVGYPTKVCQYQ